MSLANYYIETKNIAAEDLLYRWVSRQVNSEAINWLNDKRKQISNGAATRVFFTAFSAVPRYRTHLGSSSQLSSLIPIWVS